MRFYDIDYARTYEERLSGEGYPGVFVPEITGELAGCRSVIDVGAGTGFLAIPLAEKGFHVTAVEPAGAMLEIFREKIEGIDLSIDFQQSTWEDWDGPSADASVSLHSLYPMDEPGEALVKMKKKSDLALVVVRSESRTRSISLGLRKHLGIQGSRKLQGDDLPQIFKSMEIKPAVRFIEQERSFTFDDLQNEVSYYIHHLKVDVSLKEKIENYLRENCSREDDNRWTHRALHVDYLFRF